jgi:hypothetical protein
LLYIDKEYKINDLLEYYKIQSNMSIVLANSTTWGGGGGSIAVSSLHSNVGSIVLHELGHSLGKLTDEYWYKTEKRYPMEAPNMTRINSLSDTVSVKWNIWTGLEQIGTYPFFTQEKEDEDWYGWRRPHQNCRMQISSEKFCEVCSIAIAMEIAKVAEIDYYAYNRSASLDVTLRTNSTHIVNYAFAGRNDLSNVTVPNTIIVR